MGLGKTVAMLTLIDRLLFVGRASRVLIVAPLRVAVQTWPTELASWAHTKDLPYTLIRPTGREAEIQAARERAKAACRILGLPAANIVNRAATRAEERVRRALVMESTPIHIINRERIPWLVRFWRDKWPYDTVVWDESSGLRSHRSERFKAMAHVRKYVHRLHELTGTPAPETYIDLFSQIYLLDRGKRFGRGITKFRERYFSYEENRRKWHIKDGSAQAIEAKIADLVIVMREADYLDSKLPLLIDRPVTMTPEQQERYESLETEYVLEMDEGVIEVDTAGALAQKLLQLASGSVYDAARRTHVFHNHKIEELQEIREESLGAPLLVAYWFKSSLARLKAAFPDAVQMDRAGHVQHAWNRGEIPMCLVHPGSAGHGLNLQDGGHILVFFDIPYPLELYLQTIKRLARQGQKRVVKVFHIWTTGTVDEAIVPRLKAKESAQETLLRRVQEIRNGYRRRSGVASLPGRDL
jgi:SNF2 family DNA or RNA helicase